MPTGLTKSAGWQVGARKTIDVKSDLVWDFMLSKTGFKIWMGEVKAIPEPNQEFQTQEGAKACITTIDNGSHLRMQWKPADWDNTCLLQLRVIPKKGKTTIAFHQDQMLTSHQREQMKSHWKEVLGIIANRLTK